MITLTLLLALAQDPFPKPGADPTGIVLDEKNQPIAGAQVALRVDLARSSPWSRSIEQVLARTPLPRGMSNKDGEFVLPLTNEQRLLGAAGEGFFWLQVEKAGYQRWCERLPGGIATWLGSRVVLYALDERDRVSVVVRNPRAGARVQLARIWSDDPDPGETVATPEDGKVSVLLPLLPSPRPPLGPHDAVPLGYRVRVDEGAWTMIDASKSVAIECPPQRALAARSGQSDAGRATLLLTVRDGDAHPIAGARVLLTDAALPVPLPSGPFTTDAQGKLVVPRHPHAAYELRVVAEGFVPESLAYSCARGAEIPLEVVLGRGKVVRLATHDGMRSVPFVKVALHSDAGPDPAMLDRPKLMTDSLGRLLVIVPEGVPVRQMIWHGSGLTERRVEPTDDVQSTAVEAIGWTHVRMPFPTRIMGMSYRAGRENGSSSGSFSKDEVSGLLVRCLTPAVQLLQFLPQKGAPFVVRARDLEDAPRDRGVVVIDRETTARRIALRVRDPSGRPVEGIRVIVPGDPNRTHPPTESADLAEPAPGVVWIGARDLDELQIAVLHKEYLRHDLTVPARAKDAMDQPIEITLRPGVAVTLRFLPKCLDAPIGPTRFARLSIQRNAELPLLSLVARPEPNIANPEAPATIELREAVAPGEVSFTIQFGARTIRSRMTRLELGKRVVVDLDEIGAK